MSRRLLSVAAALAVLAAALGSSPSLPASATTGGVVLPPSFVEAPTASAYDITVNGVALASDATGFNHWGGEMPLYASRTGLLVEADRVRVRVEGDAPFSVAIEILSASVDPGESEGPEDDFFTVESVTDGIGGYRVPGASEGTFECDPTDEVVLPVLGDDPQQYWNSRRGFLVGDATDVGSGLYRFDCSLVMKPGGALGDIGTLLLEIGQTASFRAEAANYLSFAAYSADPQIDLFEGTRDGDDLAALSELLVGTECSYRPEQSAANLADAIFDGAALDDMAAVLDCPDGRVDLNRAGNEAHILSVYPNWRVFADDVEDWNEQDSADGPFEGLGSLRVPACGEGVELPCLESIDSGWGMNLTDFTYTFGEGEESFTRPSVELSLVRTAEDATVGYGTVADPSSDDDQVAFVLRVPTGTVRGADWSDMARAAGYSFAQVAGWGFSVVAESEAGAGDGYVRLAATLEPRERSVALNSSTYEFQCEVFVSGGVSEATPGCDLPDDVLEIERLAMFPRAWVSGQASGSSEYGASIKGQGWRLDTVTDCDPDDSPSSECSEVPGTTYTTEQQYDRVYDQCRNTIYVHDDDHLDYELYDFSDGVPVSLLAATCESPLPKGAYLELRTLDGQNRDRDENGRFDASYAVRLTDDKGKYLLVDADGDPLTLTQSPDNDGAECPAPCNPVLVPAIRGLVVDEDDVMLDDAPDGVYSFADEDVDGVNVRTYTHTYTLVKTRTADRLGRRISWLSEPSDLVGTVIEQDGSVLSIATEGEHGFEVGDSIVMGGVQSAHLDGITFTVIGVEDYALGIDVTNLLTGGSPLATALSSVATNPSCLQGGTGFISSDTLCGSDVEGIEQNQATLVLTTEEPHGLDDSEGPVEVTIALLGNEFDGTRYARVVDANRLAFEGPWYAQRAYYQDRRGTLVPGGSSRIVFTETTLTMFLDGRPEEEGAIAGGFVATNGQVFTFGEDMRTGAAFDFAVAGPSRKADGTDRDSDGFFQAFIPATFLDEAFGLTVAGAVGALEVNRRNEGSVGQVEFAADPSFVTGVSGVLISSDGFSYSAPYFAAERRTTPAPEPEGGTRGPVTLPGGTVPTVAPGARTATVGGRTVVPTVPTVTSERMELVVEGSSITLGGPGALGGLAVREVGGERRIQLEQGSSFALAGDGFEPGSVVEVWLFSEPQLLALARVAADGTLTGEVPLDGWSSGGPIPPGRHTLQVSGVGADGQVLALSVGVEIVTELTPVTTRVAAGTGGTSDAGDPGSSAPAAGDPGADGQADTGGADVGDGDAAADTPTTGTDAAPGAAADGLVADAAAADGGGALRSLGILATVLALGLATYGAVAARRRRASS